MDVRTAELVRSMDLTPRSARGLRSLRDDLLRVRASLRKRDERSALLGLAAALLDWAFHGSDNVRAQTLVEIAELLAEDLGHREGPMRLYELAIGLVPRDFSITSRARDVLGKDAQPRVEWLYLVQSRALERSDAASEEDRRTALRRLADLRAELGSVTSAIESYEKLIELAPDLSSVRRLAELLEARGEPGDAEDAEALFALTADLGAPPRPRATKTARLPAPKLPLPKLPVYVPPLPEAVAAPLATPPREALPTPIPPAPRPVAAALDTVQSDQVPLAPTSDASLRVQEAFTQEGPAPTLTLGQAPWPLTEARIRAALDVHITQLAPGSPIPLTRRRPVTPANLAPPRRLRWRRHAAYAAASLSALLGFMLTPLGSGLAMSLWVMGHHGAASVEVGAIETRTRTALGEPAEPEAAPENELLPAGILAETGALTPAVRAPEAAPPSRTVLTAEGRVKRVRGGKLVLPSAQRSLERALSEVRCPALRATPRKLDVALRLSPRGRVVAVEGRAAKLGCVRAALESARFPKLRGQAHLEAQLVLRPISTP